MPALTAVEAGRWALAAPPPEVACISSTCGPNSVCCGEDDGQYFCALHCSHCYNFSGVVSCPCDEGFHGSECALQMSPTVWLAVILTVGTMLVLFIAWGFRCQDDDEEEALQPQPRHQRRNQREPLLREAPEAAAAAASPPTPRGSNVDPSITDLSIGALGSSTEGGSGGSLTRRVCVVCMNRPLQVVVM